MNVDVATGVALVTVEMQSAAQHVPCGAGTEVYEHDADADLEIGSYRFVPVEHGVFGDEHGGSEDKERKRVAGSPRRADPEALPEVSLFGDDAGDRYDVIGISGVFQAEEEAEGKDDEKSGMNVHIEVKTVLLGNTKLGAAGITVQSRYGVARPEGFEPPTLWFEARCSVP